MIELQTALVFFGIAVVLALAPGPDNLFVLFQSLRQSWQAGLLVTLGLCTGLLVHTTAVALGLAALLLASPRLFLMINLESSVGQGEE